MGETALLNLAFEALRLMVLASLPPVLAAAGAGLLMGLFQATTQIQEATLSVAPRLCAAAAALVLSAPWTAHQVVRFATQLLETLPEAAR